MDKDLKLFLKQIAPIFLVVAIMWLVHILQWSLGKNWSEYGIFPQALDGFWGIFTAPMIHGGWEHLISNSAPMLMTGILLIIFYPSIAYRAFFMMYFFTGIMVWLFAREVYHIGASGVVYSMVSFLFWTGVFRRSHRSIFLALSILILYSGMFEGIVPKEIHVSWESHLFGGLVGIAVAYYYKNQLEIDELVKSKWEKTPYDQRPFFLPRDVFQYTKAQRIAMEEERRRQEAEELYRQQLLQQMQNNYWSSNNT